MSANDSPAEVSRAEQFAGVPRELTETPRWVLWRRETRNGKPTKVPYSPTGVPANVRDSATWVSFRIALRTLLDGSHRWHGVGFVLTGEDRIVGVDLDHCRDIETQDIAPWASDIIAKLNGYTEVSPSGTGVRIFLKGALPPGGRKRGPIEMYSEARYLTVTGAHVSGTPVELMERTSELDEVHQAVFASADVPVRKPNELMDPSDAELVRRAEQAKNGERFSALWRGERADNPSDSEADLELCSSLAFWTGGETLRVDRLFRQSGRMRPKWDKRHHSDGKTYGEGTIAAALRRTRSFYHAGFGDSGDGASVAALDSNTVTATGSSNDVWQAPLPLGESDVPAFPVEELPQWMARFVRALAIATQTPPDLAAMLTLSVLSMACAKRVVIRGRWTEPVNIYTAIALAPGNRKSSVFKAALAPVIAFEQEENRRMGPELAERQSQRKIDEQILQKAQNDAARASLDDQERLSQEAAVLAVRLAQLPPIRGLRLIADDVTPEKLKSLLSEQGGRMAVMSPEGDVFELMAGRYSSNGAPNLGVYLKGHAGDAIIVDRVGRPSEFIADPALTVGVAVQPSVIRGLSRKVEFRGQGLLARFFFSLPPSLVGSRSINPPPIVSDVQSAYDERVQRLLRFGCAEGYSGVPTPFELRMSENAQSMLDSFAESLEPKLSEFGELGGIADWASKLVGGTARLAALLHMATHVDRPAGWQTPVGVHTMEAAIQIGEYLTAHAKVAFAEMGLDGATEDARTVLRWICAKRMAAFTKRELHQALRGSEQFRRPENLTPALTLLVANGYVREHLVPDRPGPGRKPSPLYRVNPLVIPQNTQNPHNADHYEDSENYEHSSPPLLTGISVSGGAS